MPTRKENFAEGDGIPSRSQRKREALETRALASRLIELKPAVVAGFPLDNDVLRAIDDARRIKSHIARKRQLQYVAKLLRRVDEQPIRDALEEIELSARQLTARQHRAEAWRDVLLEEGDMAVSRLLAERHDADAQALRQLLRNAARESRAGKPPAAARALFRMLRDLDESEALPPA